MGLWLQAIGAVVSVERHPALDQGKGNPMMPPYGFVTFCACEVVLDDCELELLCMLHKSPEKIRTGV
jgi:hypothetical protein